MKKLQLIFGVAILLLGITKRFDGQDTIPAHRRLPSGDHNVNATMTGERLARHEFSADVDTDWVRDYPSGLLSVLNGTAIAVDGSGNVYVTGSCYYFRSGEDYFTVKFDFSGAQLWGACYKGPGNNRDHATAIVVDSAGNVYVTGWSEGTDGESDFATIKYNSEGAEQWVARYNGSGNAGDVANALVVDGAGNIYVSGTSVGSSTGDDFATIKYNSEGKEQWVARYNSTGNAADVVSDLTVDAAGNVYVTGASEDSETGYNYTTVKYNSGGAQQWKTNYNGPANDRDYAISLAVDDSGNVYVTGESYSLDTGDDYATVKYNSTGVQQWVTRYNGAENWIDSASSLALDSSGNVYVTGSSAISLDFMIGDVVDYATIKYNSDGVQQWVARYDGPWQDYAGPLKIDASGNVYVTGSSGTIKYNADGIQQWVIDLRAEALAIDSSGDVYLTGCGSDFATLKYNTDGIERWQTSYSGVEDGILEVYDIVIDAIGNVYVMGTSDGLVTYDYATVKYNSAGVQQWVARYKGALYYVEALPALAVDAFGNVYVTGTSEEAIDYVTVKYNSAGVQQWEVRYNGPGNGSDRAVALAVDGYGNVYVTGASEGSGTYKDYATIKYNSDGVEQWVARYHGTGNANDDARAIIVDATGNIYVTGRSGGPGTGDDYATIKYNSDGVQQWIARYNGPGNYSDEAIALAVDPAGNVYVTGKSWGAGPWNDYATVKYNSDGAEQWVARYNGPGNGWDLAKALAVDASGNVYVTGSSSVSNTPLTSYDYATVKYNSDGVEQWVSRYDGPVNEMLEKSNDKATALAVDASDNVYVTGKSTSSDGWPYCDFVTIKYNPAGNEQWLARYDGPRTAEDKAKALAVDGSGNVYVSGTSATDVGRAYTTIKYVQTQPVSVEKEESPQPSRFWLAQNYPNPFNPNTTIEFALPKATFVTLKVYNLLGEEVATLIAEKRLAGIYRFNWETRELASGVYLYRLEADNFIQTKKLLLIQ